MRRKQYGQASVAACPFCGKAAYAKNKDGLPVCADHKNKSLGEMKCVCGEWLEQKKSKWGAFFVCPNCGPVSVQKAQTVQEPETSDGKEEEVRPGDPRYFN